MTKRMAAILALASGLQGCGATDPPTTAALYAPIVSVVQKTSVPSSFPITVCWATPGYATEKAWVREAVTLTWQSVPDSYARFSGWGDCDGTSVLVRIVIQDPPPVNNQSPQGPHTDFFHGVPWTVYLNFTYQYWGTDCASTLQSCDRTIGVHEFGHVLGYAHEQDRFTDKQFPAECYTYSAPLEASFFYDYAGEGYTLNTTEPIDLSSVMSYCGPFENSGNLTGGDKTGTRRIYPSSFPTFHAWGNIAGGARDISVGANGDVWVAGDDQSPDGTLFKLLSNNVWQSQSFTAKRIAIAPDGTPWAVKSSGTIHRRVNNQWQQLPGGAVDIGIGAEGTVWVVGTTVASSGGNIVYRWDGTAWVGDVYAPGALRLAVDRGGNPWTVDNSQHIWRFVNTNGQGRGTSWTQLSGGGTDIGISANGTVWVVGAGGQAFWRQEAQGNWGVINVGGNFRDISVAPDGRPWGVNASDFIYVMN